MLRFELGTSPLHSTATRSPTMHVMIIETVFWMVVWGNNRHLVRKSTGFLWSLYKGLVPECYKYEEDSETSFWTKTLFRASENLQIKSFMPNLINRIALLQ